MKESKPRFNHPDKPLYESETEQNKTELVPHEGFMRKSIGYVTIVLVLFAIAGSFFTTSYLDEGTAEEVVANRISSATAAGEELFTGETNANIQARDFEVTGAGTNGGEARMLIWDFNRVDYDEVAIFIDGTPVKEKLIISENAYAVSIPVPSTVTITGVKDSGGGISYAVKFPNNKMTYFNVVRVGQSNTYTVLPAP